MKNHQFSIKAGLLLLCSLFFFTLQAQQNCAFMRVSIASDGWVACDNAVAQIRVCNEGSQSASNASLTVNIPEEFQFMSSIPAPSLINGKTLRYSMGNFPAGDCRNIAITLAVPCSAQIGEAFCLKATASPKNCPTSAPGWDGATLQVQGTCNAPDDVSFKISNIGINPTSTAQGYIITEDHLMRQISTLPIIPNGDSTTISIPAPNGKTFTFQTTQTPGHPFPEPVSVSVEGCGAPPGSTGYLLQYPQYDGDVHGDIFCDVITADISGLEKKGFPLGYEAAHFIDRRTTLNYRIRFQNNTTAAVQTVTLIDTLSSDLNLSTFRAGAASHPYTFSIQNQTLTVVFSGLQLPPASVNEAASRGFFSFNIGVSQDAPLGTVIENTASVTFNSQTASTTETTFHRLGENFILVAVVETPSAPDFKVVVMPNPIQHSARFVFSGTAASGNLVLQISDVSGRVFRTLETTNDQLDFEKNDLPSGLYIFTVSNKDGQRMSGKMMVF